MSDDSSFFCYKYALGFLILLKNCSVDRKKYGDFVVNLPQVTVNE